jgi:hypothetical protein
MYQAWSDSAAFGFVFEKRKGYLNVILQVHTFSWKSVRNLETAFSPDL